MSFKKEFRAVPIKLGPRYRAIEADRRRRSDNGWAGAILAVSTIGMGIGFLSPTTATPSASETDATRLAERSVYYAGCNEARAAGAAPIYKGKPAIDRKWTATATALRASRIAGANPRFPHPRLIPRAIAPTSPSC